jgi:hypothetical protein
LNARTDSGVTRESGGVSGIERSRSGRAGAVEPACLPAKNRPRVAAPEAGPQSIHDTVYSCVAEAALDSAKNSASDSNGVAVASIQAPSTGAGASSRS